jgi:DNA-binding MarR family transcriptional regulator
MEPDRGDAVEDLRAALREMLAAQRRLRGRDAARPDLLSFSQYTLLRVLASGGEHSAGELAAAAEVSPAAVTKLLDTLQASGVLERVRGGPDRRRVGVRITPAGHELLAVKDAAIHGAWEDVLDGVELAEIETTAAAVRRVASLFDAF